MVVWLVVILLVVVLLVVVNVRSGVREESLKQWLIGIDLFKTWFEKEIVVEILSFSDKHPTNGCSYVFEHMLFKHEFIAEYSTLFIYKILSKQLAITRKFESND